MDKSIIDKALKGFLKDGDNYYTFKIDQSGNFLMIPHGGGFARKISEKEFAGLELVDSIPELYVKTIVAIDDDISEVAYINPAERWNGWRMPLFDLDAVNRLSAVINSVEGALYTFSPYVKDGIEGYMMNDIENEDQSFFEPIRTITIDGKEIKVVAIFAGIWTWGESAPQDAHCYGEHCNYWGLKESDNPFNSKTQPYHHKAWLDGFKNREYDAEAFEDYRKEE